MQDTNLEKVAKSDVEPKIIETDVGAKSGQNKCPKCGATDIALNINTGKLRCNFCRYEFTESKVADQIEISDLKGQVIGSGATDIIPDTKDILTFKCSSCGAEVVIDTNEALQARCHWCRNTLSVNEQIPNGAVPDMILPFSVKKEDAKVKIENFVKKRKFFAHPKFKQEFTLDNVMGVYLPYMVIDVNSHVKLTGHGEKLVRKYTRKVGDSYVTYYDADLYDVDREFDLEINNLTVESSKDKLDTITDRKTNNIINSIMPFDIENCVKWDANYLKGYTSERRDTNIEDLQNLVYIQSKDIARFKANETLTQYDRGVCWEKQDLDVNGQLWKAAYLPIWLYSYQQVKGKKHVLHYVAVNARTKETMGSIPIHMPKLLGFSALVELFGLLFWWIVLIDWDFGWLMIFSGIVFYFVFYGKYRNKKARHKHETETEGKMLNLKKVDNYVRRRTGLPNSMIGGANNNEVSLVQTDLLDVLSESNSLIGAISKTMNKH